MTKLIYIQDDFLDPKLCQPFLELYDKGLVYKKEN